MALTMLASGSEMGADRGRWRRHRPAMKRMQPTLHAAAIVRMVLADGGFADIEGDACYYHRDSEDDDDGSWDSPDLKKMLTTVLLADTDC
ncbi:hypothetical protein ACLOJK_019614 [Asimina triloba]